MTIKWIPRDESRYFIEWLRSPLVTFAELTYQGEFVSSSFLSDKLGYAGGETVDAIVLEHILAGDSAYMSSPSQKWTIYFLPKERTILAIAIEITETATQQRKIQEELKISTARLDKQQQVLNSFYNHEVRSPLGTAYYLLQIYLEKRQGFYIEQAMEVLQRLIESTAKSTELYYGSTLDKQVVLVEEIVEETIKDLQLKINTSGAAININDSQKDVTVFGDRIRLRQALLNLVENGIKYGKKGEIAVILIDWKQADGYTEIKVEDNGIGIQSRHFQKILKHGQRLHPLAEYPGSGLGLAIVNDVVLEHGGKLVIESELDVGSKFTMYLPYESPPAPS